MYPVYCEIFLNVMGLNLIFIQEKTKKSFNQKILQSIKKIKPKNYCFSKSKSTN